MAPVLSVQAPPPGLTRVTRWFSFPAAIGFMLFLAVFFNACQDIAEPDIWWHLRNANHILSAHAFPRFDQYSFTAAGAPWIDHEWLSEIVYYAGFRAFGLRGIVAVYLALSLIILTALYYLSCRSGANPKDAAIVMSLGIVVASVSFGPRMLLFGWVFMIALLILLQRFASTRSGPLWLIPPLFCVWINFHGSWLFGLVVLGIFIASGLVQGEWGIIWAERFTAAELKKLVLVAVLAMGALFVNPFGYKLVSYPFDLMFHQQTNINNIDEWRSVDFHDPRGKVVMALLLAIFASTVVSRRRWKLYEVLLGAFALYAGLMYWRMQFFLALIFVPLLATRLQLFPPYDERKEKPILNGAIMAAVLLIMFLRFPSEAKLKDNLRGVFPETALSFMRDHNISDRVFNDYLWGGYMVWYAPQIKTFIDGRADLFVYNGVFDDYLKIVGIQNSLELLNRYRIGFALLIRDRSLAYLLGHNPCWREIYKDKMAALYQRDETGGTGCKLPPPNAGHKD